MGFKKAVKKNISLRMALIGISGSGKTWNSLSICKHLGGRTALIDTEHESSLIYADDFDFDADSIDGDYHPKHFISKIKDAASMGYDNLIIDSLSHSYFAKGGILDLVDQISKKSYRGNFVAAWKDVTPLQLELFEAILSYPGNIIATMRAKSDYVDEEVETNGYKKTVKKKVGMAAVGKENFEYEFAIVGKLTKDNELFFEKTRCFELADAFYRKEEIASKFVPVIKRWMARTEDVDQEAELKAYQERLEKLDQDINEPELKAVDAPKSNKTILEDYAAQYNKKWTDIKPLMVEMGITDAPKLKAMSEDQLEEAKALIDDQFAEAVA